MPPEIAVPSLDALPGSSPAPSATPAPAPVSPDPTPDAPAASSTATPDAPAASSPAPDALPASSPEPSDTKAELLKAVTKAIQPKTPETPAEAKEPNEAQADDDDEASDPNAPTQDPTSEELKDYSPSAQRRIKELVKARNEYRAQAEEIQPFRSFMQDHELSTEDLSFSLQALATLRSGDYESFLTQIHPFYQMAMEYTGRALPPDLSEQVRQGKLAPEAAVTMTRQRYELGDARQRLEHHNEVSQQQQEENARQANRSTVAAWEQTIKQSDPDYARKLDVAKAYVAGIRAERGDPTNPAEALAIAQEAYDRASKALKAALPARQATTQSPSGISRPPTPSAVAAPRSLMEAAMQGLSRAQQRAS